MAMVRMFVSEWQAFAGAVQASHHEVPTAEHARLHLKWIRKQIGAAVVATGAMLLFLHGMSHLTA